MSGFSVRGSLAQMRLECFAFALFVRLQLLLRRSGGLYTLAIWRSSNAAGWGKSDERLSWPTGLMKESIRFYLPSR